MPVKSTVTFLFFAPPMRDSRFPLFYSALNGGPSSSYCFIMCPELHNYLLNAPNALKIAMRIFRLVVALLYDFYYLLQNLRSNHNQMYHSTTIVDFRIRLQKSTQMYINCHTVCSHESNVTQTTSRLRR